MASVFDTAKYILEKSGEMDPIKLQKLLYFAQAWSMVWDDTPLFPEDFQAWGTGPVCMPLRERFEGHSSLSASDISFGDSSKLSDTQKRSIDLVLDHYGSEGITELIWDTQQGKPWRSVYRRIAPPDETCDIIPKDSIAIYYGGLD